MFDVIHNKLDYCESYWHNAYVWYFFDTMYKNKSELECQKAENIEYGTVHAIFYHNSQHLLACVKRLNHGSSF